MQRVEEVLTAQTMFTVYDVIRASIELVVADSGVSSLVDPVELDKHVRAAIQQMSDRGIVFRETLTIFEPISRNEVELREKYSTEPSFIVVHESHKMGSRSDVGQLCTDCATCVCHDKTGRLTRPCTRKPV